MHHETDVRFPIEMIPPDQMEDAPLWARKLSHNVRHLLRRVHELEERLEGLDRQVKSMGVCQEALATGVIPGEA